MISVVIVEPDGSFVVPGRNRKRTQDTSKRCNNLSLKKSLAVKSGAFSWGFTMKTGNVVILKEHDRRDVAVDKDFEKEIENAFLSVHSENEISIFMPAKLLHQKMTDADIDTLLMDTIKFAENRVRSL